MEKIMPVSDLRNYNEILRVCDAEGKVHLTKHGRGAYVVVTNSYLEELQAKMELMTALLAGEASVKDESSWVSIADAKQRLGV